MHYRYFRYVLRKPCYVFTTLVSIYISLVGFAIILIFAFTNDRKYQILVINKNSNGYMASY